MKNSMTKKDVGVAKLNCIHHWIIGGNNVGTCKKCGAVKDFGRLTERMSTSDIYMSQRSHKGLPCPFKPIICEEGYCQDCQICLDWQKRGKGGRSEERVRR